MQSWCQKPFKIAVSIPFSAGSAATACRRPRTVSGTGITLFFAHWFAQQIFSVLATLVLLTAGLIISVKGHKMIHTSNCEHFLFALGGNSVCVTYVGWMFLWELGVTGRCKVSSTPGCGRGFDFLFTFDMLVIIWKCKQSEGKDDGSTN